MIQERLHHAVSMDGTLITGRVQGRGPALVLVHGGIGDGAVAWEALLPHLTDRFTCYLPSTRGRGLSGDHPDHSPTRLADDVTAFVDSIGEPVRLVGWSGSAAWVLEAAGRTAAAAAVAVYEPTLISAMDEHDLARTFKAMEQVGVAAANGRLEDALRAFTAWICTDAEAAALEDTDFYDRWAGCVPAMLRFVQADASFGGTRSTDPRRLKDISAPVLLFRGQQTALGAVFIGAIRHIAEHLSDVYTLELPDAGHFAPVIAPEPMAAELIEFFESVQPVVNRQSA